MPAAAKRASTCSASPPSVAHDAADLAARLANASSVFSGMVSMVSGAASASTYRVGDAFGSLVPVLAHSMRCLRAPAAARSRQRLPAMQVAVRAVGARRRSAMPEPVAQLRRHLVGDGPVPAADEERGHRAHARIELGGDAPLDAAHVGLRDGQILLAREQQGDVDRYAGENGLLDRGNARRRARDLDVQVGTVGQLVDAACGLDGRLAYRSARSGDTSIETQPSMPAVRSNTGRNRSAARRRSSSASSTNNASPDSAGLAPFADAVVVQRGAADRLVEDGRDST